MSSTPPSTPPSPIPPSTSNDLSDIFSSSPSTTLPPNPNTQEPSDIPRVRTTHITSGYRHGISVSKTTSLQPGFDEGYGLGAVFGIRAGRVVGVLEGLQACCGKVGGKEEKDGGGEREREKMGKLLKQAREELAIERVFGAEWWGEGGWRYEVKGGEEGEVTWKEVVDQHPVVREWERRVGEEVERRGVRRGVFEGREWEGGRVES